MATQPAISSRHSPYFVTTSAVESLIALRSALRQLFHSLVYS